MAICALRCQALALADNKIADSAGWDLELLALELQELSQLDLSFDLEVTGFDTAEINLLIDGTKAAPQPFQFTPPRSKS